MADADDSAEIVENVKEGDDVNDETCPPDSSEGENANENEEKEEEEESPTEELDENMNPIMTLKDLQSRLKSEHESVQEGTLLENFESERVLNLRGEIQNCQQELKKCNVYLMAVSDNISSTRDVMSAVVQTITSKLKQEFKPFEPGEHPMSPEELKALELATKAHDTFAEATKDLQNLLIFTAEINESACQAAAAAAAAATAAGTYDESLGNAQKTLEEEEEERKKKEEEEKRIKEEEEAERKRQEEEEAARKKKEEEERKRQEEEEKKKKEVDRKPGETDEEREKRLREEEERKKKEEEIKRNKEEAERKEKERRDPANWTPIIYNIDADGFERGIGCIARALGDELKQENLICTKLDLLDPQTGMALCDNEELVGHVTTIAVANDEEEPLKFEEPICLAVPHCAPKNINYRVAVLKVKNEDGNWVEVDSSRDAVFEDYKDIRFIEMNMKTLKSVTCAVVTRLRDDKEVINNRGGKVTSSVDSRINMQFAKNSFRLSTPVRLQVQPVDQMFVNDMKSRHKGCENLLSASSILYLSMANNFSGAPTVSIPAPGGLSKKRARGRTAVSREKGGTKLPARPATTHGVQDKEDEVEDALHLLIQGKNNAWVRVPGVEFTPGRGDVVTFPLETQTSRILVIKANGSAEAAHIAAIPNVIDRYLQERVVKFMFRQKESEPREAVVDCVRAEKCEKSSDYYKTEGYSFGPLPSKDVILYEGQVVKVTFRGNLKFEGDPCMKFVFNSNMDSARTPAFLTHREFYAQKGFDSYMGHAQFWTEVAGDENHNDVMLCEMCVKIPKPPPQNPQPLNRVPLQMQSGGILCKETMQHLAKQIGDDWDTLATHLLLKKATIQQIKRENYDADSDKLAHDALLHWYKYTSRGIDKVKKLCEALESCNHVDLAADLAEKDKQYKIAQARKVEEANLLKAYASIVRSSSVIKEWKMLARELGVPECDVTALESNHGNNLKEQCYQGLLKWQDIKGHDATLLVLIDVLRDCRHKNVADQLQARFKVQPVQDVEEE